MRTRDRRSRPQGLNRTNTMSEKTYPASAVDEILQNALVVLEEAFATAKAATAEAESLRKQAEDGGKVILEKVAAADPALVKETVDTLVRLNLIGPENQEKLASELTSDPKAIFKLATRLASISISDSAHQEGAGVMKSASQATAVSDPDGWGKCITKGA